MTLDYPALSQQVRSMGEHLAGRRQLTRERLDAAVETLTGSKYDWAELQQRIDAAESIWLVAEPLQDPRVAKQVGAPPSDYTVVASDGSSIEPDRHGTALCYLINIGTAVISYGNQARASLRSAPALGYKDEDLYISYQDRENLVSGHLLDLRRSIMEVAGAAQAASDLAGPIVCLVDGTLVLRSLEGWGMEEYLKDTAVRDYLAPFNELRDRDVPIASYVSRPRATDVINLLRLVRCPHPTVKCRRDCPEPEQRKSAPCREFDGLTDGMLFYALLEDGERSVLFLSPAPLSKGSYGEHRVCFFYMNVGSEVCRVEVPWWVANSEDKMGLVESVVRDQCRRGDGYPRAVMESHEKAVLAGADRTVFQQVLDSMMLKKGLKADTSQKQRSKRLRGL